MKFFFARRQYFIALALGVGLVAACTAAMHRTSANTPPLRSIANTDEAAAWQGIYSVLTHPRCVNCHTATDYPQQGDERRRHAANVVRGPEGSGVPGLQCASCHQTANSDSTGVPGGHNWHLAPLSMQWQDETDRLMSSAQVCRALRDEEKNHGLSGPELLHHHEVEALVLWAWRPGLRPDGRPRSVPPLTHEEFVEATRRWVAAGMPCPELP